MQSIRIIVSSVLLACAAGIAHADANKPEDNACLEGPIEQFGRYIGDWKIDDETLAQDGSGWGPGKGVRWIFECIGDGTAVQDFWMPNSGGWGTNLRSYNPDTEKWEIVWTARALNGLTHISAKQDDSGNIVMDILKPVPNPPRRITFLPPHETGWDWVMEMSFDEGETWTEVYKIKATPWQEEAD